MSTLLVSRRRATSWLAFAFRLALSLQRPVRCYIYIYLGSVPAMRGVSPHVWSRVLAHFVVALTSDVGRRDCKWLTKAHSPRCRKVFVVVFMGSVFPRFV